MESLEAAQSYAQAQIETELVEVLIYNFEGEFVELYRPNPVHSQLNKNPQALNMLPNPQKLFVIDGIGAIASAFFLGVVLVQLQHLIGMPRNTLYFLAILPILFVLYDAYAYQQVKKAYNWPYLKVIAFVNLSYCFVSVAMLFLHYDALTTLGWLYFIGEILIILVLVVIELKVDAKWRE